jgi:hypothetical protein
MEIARLQENLNNSYYIYRAGHTVLSSSIYNVTAYTPGLHEFIPTYSGVRVVRSLIFSVLFCRSIFFFWPLLCVHLRFTASVYLFGIFKLIFYVILVHVYTYFELLKIRIDDAQWLNRSKITDKTYKHKHSLTLLLYCPCLCYHSFLQNTMSSCSLEANLSIFLKIVCLYVFALEIQLFTGESLGPIYRFKPATIVCLSQASTWISYVICCGRFGVQLFEVRGDLPFCWYCWPSLFNFSLCNAINT